MQKAKWLSGEALQIAIKRKEVKSKGEKERYSHLNAEFQKIVRRDKKEILWGGKWEGGSCLGTCVHPWWIHVNVWQNQYSIVK